MDGKSAAHATAGCVCRFVWASVLVDQGERQAETEETGEQGGDCSKIRRKGRRRDGGKRGCKRMRQKGEQDKMQSGLGARMGMKGKADAEEGASVSVVCVCISQGQVRFLLFFLAQPSLFSSLALFAVFDALALLRSPSQ